MANPSLLTGEQATAMGYRRTSNRYLICSRIDRADWLDVLAKELGRSPAQFFVPGAREPEGCWGDYYRRVISRDKIELREAEFRKVPGSDHDDCGYIAVASNLTERKVTSQDFYPNGDAKPV